MNRINKQISLVRFAIKYFKYIIFARHKKGHGIHSPFVYELITKVFNNKEVNINLDEIEKTRKKLLSSDEWVAISGIGSGSKYYRSGKVRLSIIAKNSSIPKKYGILLYNLCRYFKPKTIIELGTSCGISAMYMVSSYNDSKVYTIEGEKDLVAIAQQNFKQLGFDNIEVIYNDFDKVLQNLLLNIQPDALFYIDGNHSKDATTRYTNLILDKSKAGTIIVIDDIHWNKDMESAWDEIRSNDNVDITIDLFRMGIIFLKEGITKQNFVIKF